MLTRKRQVPSKIESVEGVAETLAIADAKSLAYNPKVNFDPGLFKCNPARASLSNIGDLVGKRPGSLTFGLRSGGPVSLRLSRTGRSICAAAGQRSMR